jgi:phage-related protein
MDLASTVWLHFYSFEKLLCYVLLDFLFTSNSGLRGFSGAGVLEIVDDFDGDTYRAIYTVKFEGVIYLLHSFQKKSKHGIATPKQDIELVKKRLKIAQENYLQQTTEKME